MAESFAKVVHDGVPNEVLPPPRRTHKLGWCESAQTAAAFNWSSMGCEGGCTTIHAHYEG